jgi:hypothetical protein
MKPSNRIVASLTFAAACLTVIAVTPAARAQMSANGAEVMTNGPRIDPDNARLGVVAPKTGAGGVVAQTVAITSPVQPPTGSMTSPDFRPDSNTAAILEALGCTLAESASHDRCAR